jgi:uncharacterized protein YhaN
MNALIIRKLTVKQSAGFPHRGLPTMEFGDGVNIVFGPNASGKTTTARAIHALLWPDTDTQDTVLAADILVDGTPGHYQCLGGMRTGELPLSYLGDKSLRHRYMLAQHELLTANDRETGFAEVMLKEARGGLDLQAAMRQLGYQKPGRLSVAEYVNAQRDYVSTKNAERQISDIETKLRDIDAQLAEARLAGERLARLTEALDYLAQAQAVTAAEEALADFPPEMATLTGQEAHELQELTAAIATAESEREKATLALVAAEEDRTRTGLTDLATADAAGAKIGAACTEVERLDTALEGKRAELRRAENEAQSAFTNLGGQGVADRPLTVETVHALGAFVKQAEEAVAAQQAVVQQQRWLGSITRSADPVSADRLREASLCLQQWLACGEAPQAAPATPLLVACAVGAVCALVAAVVTRSPFAVLACLAAVVAGVLVLLRPKAAGPSRAALEARFAALDVAPVAWHAADVERLLLDLDARRANVMVHEATVPRSRELQEALAACEETLHTLIPEAERIAEAIGVDPAQVLQRPHGQWYLVEQLMAWQQKHALAQSARAELAALTADRQAALDAANAALASFGYPPAASGGEARNQLALLSERKRAFQAADSDARHARQRREEQEERREGHVRARLALLARLGLGEDADAVRRQLETLLPRLPAYRAAVEGLATARAVRDAAARKAGAQPEFIARGEANLRVEIAAAQSLADRIEEISGKKGDFERQVAMAKVQAACEQAQVRLEREAAALRRKAEDALRAHVGWLLATQVETQVLGDGMPDVFVRAQALFARFTNGRYDLPVPRSAADLRAFDREDNVERTLDQLSSGTRVQLLIAVRVAFVEMREQGARLPLLMDETLACSDEQRERAIIDAALEIARQGRQVFYFTSKPAELAQWRAQAGDTPLTVINLAETPSDAVRTPVAYAAIPDPAGLDAEAYAAALGVAAVDFVRTGAGKAHVWYAVDDPAALHTLLQAGITTCGQLRQPLLAGAIEALLGPEAARRALTRAALVAELERLWWIGRGQPLTYEALHQSGVLATTFKAELLALAEAKGWDANEFITALKSRVIKGFQERSITRLEKFCFEHGHLVDETPLDPDALYTHLLAAAADAIARGELTAVDVRLLFDRVCAPVAVA